MRLHEALRRSNDLASLDELLNSFRQGGLLGMEPHTTLGSKEEEPTRSFEGFVEQIYKRNGVVFACMAVRMALFSEARFQYRRQVNGRPGELFGTQALKPLEEPWPGGTTRDLLNRAIQDTDLAGSFYAARRPGGRIMRMRPDWVTVILGSRSDPNVAFGDVDAEILGYSYKPGGPAGNKPAMPFLREDVAHWAPTPDPLASFRGMSWLTPVLREITSDGAATTHKLKFFENGATPNMVVSLDANIKREEFEEWLKLFRENSEGAVNAYRTLYLGAGAKPQQVGSDLKNVDFKAVQGAGETRIAAAAGTPPVIVGLSEGLAAATYSNYGQARRRFADGTMRPLWGGFAGAMAPIMEVPPGADLWYDDRDISFLQEDRKDEAEILSKESATIKTLIDAGYEPGSVVQAVKANDLSRLAHSGLVSVQLQPPGSEAEVEAEGERGRRVLVPGWALQSNGHKSD